MKILLAYDGSEFRGFVKNPNVLTVEEELTKALEQVLGCAFSMVCAGRTDAGVHAFGQVVSVAISGSLNASEAKVKNISESIDLEALKKSLNSICPESISIRAISFAPDNFDARLSATSRFYHYYITRMQNPLIRHAWHIEKPLDLKAMKKATRFIIGEQDFSSFCRKDNGNPEKSLSRFVMRASWELVDVAPFNLPSVSKSFKGVQNSKGENGLKREQDFKGLYFFSDLFRKNEHKNQLLRFHIQANAFCHQMVRSIVGTLVDIGLGKFHWKDMQKIIEAKDRSRAGQLAPPNGLILQEVFY